MPEGLGFHAGDARDPWVHFAMACQLDEGTDG